MVFFIHWNDLPVIFAIVAGVLVPEIVHGFEQRHTLTRTAILVFFCVLSTAFSYYLQTNVDPGGAFTRAFLIGAIARVLLLSSHIAQAQLAELRAIHAKLERVQKEEV